MNTIDKSPGETAYDAYYTDCASIPFAAMTTVCRAAWEAAAQAVLDRDRSTLDAVVKELESCRHALMELVPDAQTHKTTLWVLERIEAADVALAKAKAAQ
jgi:hypothetical protein